MAKGFLSKPSFAAGAQTPRLDGREDLQQYQSGARKIQNGVVQVHGGVARRTGTRFVTPTKNSNVTAILVSFVADDDAAYLLEIGNLYMRFITSGDGTEDGLGYVSDGGSGILELQTPWALGDLTRLNWDQSVDVMYFVCPGYFPQKLRRTSPTTFSLDDVVFSKGRAPTRSIVTSSTIKENLGAGLVSSENRRFNITADTAAEMDLTGVVEGGFIYIEAPDALYDTTDPDLTPQPMSIAGNIVSVAQNSPTSTTIEVSIDLKSGTEINGDLIEDRIGNVALGERQQLEAFYATGLFLPHSAPSAADGQGAQFVSFHEGRLGYFGLDSRRDAFVLSVSDDFDNFERSSPDPAALDDQNADKSIFRRLVSSKFNAISWAASTENALLIGTRNNEFVVRGTDDGVLTPLGLTSRPATNRGSDYHIPVVIEGRPYFIQRGGRRMRALDYQLSDDGLAAVDVSVFAEHLYKRGIRELEYQQDPEGVIWARMEDGRMVGMTVENDQEMSAAHEHILGGSFNGGIAKIENMAVTPGNIIGSDQDILWLLVARTINGETRRHIEYVLPIFEPNIGFDASEFERIRAAEEARFVDSSLTFYNPVSVIDVLPGTAGPRVITATDHGLAAGDKVRFRNMGEVTLEQDTGAEVFTSLGALEYQVLLVDFVFSTTEFEVTYLDGSSFDLGGAEFDSSSGLATVAKQVTTVSGLSHLEGEEVAGLADGSPFTATVSSGAIELPFAASRVHVGLNYNTIITTNRYFGTSRLGSDQGQTKAISRMTARFLDTIGGQFARGSNPFAWEALILTFGDGQDVSNAPVPVFTGDAELAIDSSWEDDPVLTFRQTEPFPMTLLAVFPEMTSGGDD